MCLKDIVNMTEIRRVVIRNLEIPRLLTCSRNGRRNKLRLAKALRGEYSFTLDPEEPQNKLVNNEWLRE